MKIQNTTKTVIIASIILLVGATIAFARGGWGGGWDGPMTRGYGGQLMGTDCDGTGAGNCRGWGKRGGYGNLSQEEAAKVEQAREKFYTDTKEIRRNMNALRVDLRDEMTKDTPDSAKALKMQKELSGIEAQFDQKRIQHQLEMRKLLPEKFKQRGFGRGYGDSYCRGYDHSRGHRHGHSRGCGHSYSQGCGQGCSRGSGHYWN
jgi:Spy/CpxP family protein refolding chaperone